MSVKEKIISVKERFYDFCFDIKNRIRTIQIERNECRTYNEMINDALDKLCKGQSPDESNRLATIYNALFRSMGTEAVLLEDYDGEDELGGPIIRAIYECGNCSQPVFKYNKYCSHCGKRIYWR